MTKTMPVLQRLVLILEFLDLETTGRIPQSTIVTQYLQVVNPVTCYVCMFKPVVFPSTAEFCKRFQVTQILPLHFWKNLSHTGTLVDVQERGPVSE